MNEIKVIQSEPGKPIIVRVVHSRFDEDAWIGLFKAGSGDNEHGDRWKWMRDVDVSHITLPAQGVGEWSVRLFKDGGYERISSLDFHVTNSHSSVNQADAESNKRQVTIPFVIGIILLSMGLPLLIIGATSTSEDRLAILIPGAILFVVGDAVAIVAAAIGMGFGKRATTSQQDMDQQRRGSGIDIVYSQVAAPKYREEFIPISEYDEIWNDKGSRAHQDVSVWRPRLPAGCHLLGMTAKNGHSPPTFPTLVIRASGSDIAPPERFDLVWWQERGQRRFWCWRPIPPPGYVSLGDVGTLSEHPPSPRDVVCVALECLSPNKQPLGDQIWNDRGGGAPKDGAFFAKPGSTGLFRCSDDNTHNRPRGEFYLPGKSDTTSESSSSTSPENYILEQFRQKLEEPNFEE